MYSRGFRVISSRLTYFRKNNSPRIVYYTPCNNLSEVWSLSCLKPSSEQGDQTIWFCITNCVFFLNVWAKLDLRIVRKNVGLLRSQKGTLKTYNECMNNKCSHYCTGKQHWPVRLNFHQKYSYRSTSIYMDSVRIVNVYIMYRFSDVQTNLNTRVPYSQMYWSKYLNQRASGLHQVKIVCLHMYVRIT